MTWVAVDKTEKAQVGEVGARHILEVEEEGQHVLGVVVEEQRGFAA